MRGKMFKANKDSVEFHITEEQVEVYKNAGYEVTSLEDHADTPEKPKKDTGKRKKGGGADDGGTTDDREGAPTAETGDS